MAEEQRRKVYIFLDVAAAFEVNGDVFTWKNVVSFQYVITAATQRQQTFS